MKIALCTTTIHVPHALKLMRKCSANVSMFVATEKDFSEEAFIVCKQARAQPVLGEDWKCSKAIGWNTLARRNIAFLEALKAGADVIYSWDNDNLIVRTDHFYLLEQAIAYPLNGIKIEKMREEAWFDPGKLLIPATRHRGFPHHKSDKGCRAEPVTDARIGAAAGLVIGDPDIDAVTRMEHRPDIGSVHILGQTGVVVDPHTWTVFNSQNTAVIRELVPAWFMMPGVGRHDDIYASLIVQRVARERDLHVHFGPPFTYQQRNEHNLIMDLRAEIDGMENTQKLAELLGSIELPDTSVIDQTHMIYDALRANSLVTLQQYEAAVAWLEDCESLGLNQ
jgi:hypothetical protein